MIVTTRKVIDQSTWTTFEKKKNNLDLDIALFVTIGRCSNGSNNQSEQKGELWMKHSRLDTMNRRCRWKDSTIFRKFMLSCSGEGVMFFRWVRMTDDLNWDRRCYLYAEEIALLATHCSRMKEKPAYCIVGYLIMVFRCPSPDSND